MISAMAKTGRVLDDADRIKKSARAMEFILSNLRTPEGKILRRYREGEARYDGYLFDYTATATACLDLYEATHEPHYIQTARELMQRVDEKFLSDDGTYHETASDGEELLVRQVSGYDGVEPSGNSNAAFALLRLSAYLADPSLSLKAEKVFLSFNEELMEYGLNSAFMLQALHLYLGGLKEVAVVGKKNDLATQEFLDTLRKGFYPNAVFAFAYGDEAEKAGLIIPLLKDRKLVNGKATAYVCRQGTCLAPVHTVEDLVKLLSYE